MSLDRALALIALACDPAASEEESRTAAVAACKLISKEKLLNGGGGWVEQTISDERHTPKPPKSKGPKPSRKNKPAGHHQNPRPSPFGTRESRRAELLKDTSFTFMKMGTGKVLCAVCHTFIPLHAPAWYWPNRRPFENTAHYDCVR